jgi:chaperonin GroEL
MVQAKKIVFEEEARQKLAAGIGQVAEAVVPTLGPKGRNVGIEKSWGAPTVTSDGNAIMKEMELPCQYENMGAALARDMASKLNDGSTTALVLLHVLVQNGIKNITSGSSPIGLKRGIDRAIGAVQEELNRTAVPVKGDAETRSIATVSASGDAEVGGLIADAMKQAGKGGVVTIEEGKGTETTIELVEGMQFDRGYMSPYFVTDQEKMSIEMEHPSVLVVDGKIAAIQELLPILQAIASTGRELLIIAEDIEGDALATLVVNRIRGSLKVAAAKAPGFGDRRKAMLQDIAALTGATLVSEETGMSLKQATTQVLGAADKVKITKDATTIIHGHGAPEQIASRVKQIEAEIAKTTSSYDKEKLEERRAKLSSGVAIIQVGAATEPEMKQRKQLFEGALAATRDALEAGTVAGGGVALLRAAAAAEKLNLEGDELIGAQLVVRALREPARKIIANCGFDPSVTLQRIEEAQGAMGFNGATGQIEDLVQAGIIDPAKTVKAALAHAASIAGMVLLSEALIGEADEELEESA